MSFTNPPGTQTSTAGVPVSLQLNAVAQPSGTVSFNSPGLSLNTSTGVISGTPTTAGMTSVSVAATANQDIASVNFNWQVLRGSTISLSSTPSSIVSGQNVTLTATVSPGPGGGTPSGTVTFPDGSNTLGTGTLNASGVATLVTNGIAAGSSTVTVTYNGDTTFGQNSNDFT